MKNNLVRVSILVLGAAAAYAQNLNVLKVNVPFDFNARGVNMPAGNYTVEAKSPTMVLLHSRENRKGTFVGTNAAQSLSAPQDGRLVFHRYGNQYFLSAIWKAGARNGWNIPPAKQERSLAKHQTEPGEVIVAALLQ